MKELSPAEKMMGQALLGNRLFILGQVGAAMILLTSLHPFFALYNITALVALNCTIVWDLWRTASKGAKRIIALIMLACAIVILVNQIGRFVLPPVHDPKLAFMAGITMAAGAVGHLLILIGAIAGLMAVKLMD